MIEGLFLRWVVTILFALAAAQCLYSLLQFSMPWKSRVGHVLHLVMSVGMLVMAWPFSMDWSTTPPMVFFGLAAVWFVSSIILPDAESAATDCGCVPPTDGATGRGVAAYHAVMMGAMAWMYAVMNGTILPSFDGDGGGDHGMALAMPSDGGLVIAHEHGGSDGVSGMHMHAGQPGYVAPVNWMLGVGFVVAAFAWLYVYFKNRRVPSASSDVLAFSSDLCQVFMAAGMGIMFLAMV
ncbi:hypothetical protein nbrc107696_10560 [Gordonia spumicola]|uniref:DUF5134 domain-containing protein n=1 Tax=Gordonia spumicola TaxID=589161 RepID=A0A7I9V6A8_9ACTN|nr:DUF5134 domain-containing protein [Gordonia spumicola]GEE00610.1 hypothetical protein nbrc107696_10560 [Gordonia spumicola]